MRAKRTWRTMRLGCVVAVIVAASGCGGGGDTPDFLGDGSGGGSGTDDWTPGIFAEASTYEAQCANPREGNDPDGNPWPDRQGTFIDENNFLRSYSNDTYLWYREILDRDPSLYPNTLEYFDLLKTTATTPSGKSKDDFHFTYDTDEWLALSQSGISVSYGAEFAVLQREPPRQIVVAFTNPNTPAADAGLVRGTEILVIDGASVSNGAAGVLNSGLSPSLPGELHNFEVRDPDGTVRNITLRADEFPSQPVLEVRTLPAPNADVGYILFNDHIATAEAQLVDAIELLDQANVSDLVLDLRYNGGGFLAIAAQLSYMIAGPARTDGRTFELQQFNDKYPSRNPVTGQTLAPVPFYNVTLGFGALPVSQDLPTLDLSRVFVITGSGTCSASEAIINGLRGVGVEVIQIGSTTCGKPYGFYATDNCGTTYFTIQFRGVNDANFGDYADGFIPSLTGTSVGSEVPGCPVGDDFSKPLGDITEDRLSAALAYRASGTCPALAATSGDPERALLRTATDQAIVVPKPPWRENRIMVRP